MAVTMAGSSLAGMPTVMAAEAYGSPIQPKADTYVNSLDNDGANGAANYAQLGSTTGDIPAGINSWNDLTEDINIAYLSFDISSIDASILDDASLKLKITEGADAAAGATVSVFEAAADVTEDGTVWENKPQIVDRVREQGQIDNITSEDAVAMTEVSGEEIVIKGLGKIVKTAKEAGKNTITFAVYLNKDAAVKIATKEDTANAPAVELTQVDMEAVAAAEAAINAVPDVTIDNYQSPSLSDARAAAIAAYEALTATEKTLLSEEAYTKLMTFRDDVVWNNTITEYGTAKQLIDDITALDASAANMTAENYTEYKADIAALRTRYDSASFRVRAIVGNKTYQLLENAEKKYAAFETADIDAVKEKISLIGEVTQDNYLDRGAFIIDARKAYDAFDALTKEAYGEGTDGYKSVMDRFVTNTEGINYLETLTEAEAPIAEYKKVTADAFVEAWNDVKAADSTILTSDPAKVAEREALLNEFEAGYYSSAVNNLSISAYYNDFADGKVTEEAAAAIEEFLCAEYQLAVDEIRAEYGDPGSDPKNPAPEFVAQFDEATAGMNLYIYLYDYRSAAEEAYAKLNEESKTEYADQSTYCDIVYEAMMNIIDAKIRATLDLNLGDAELTKPFIDSIKRAKADRDSISAAIIDYLENYETTLYAEYKAKSDEIDAKLEDLANLAADELAKYGAIIDELDAYGLYYMSGYTVDGEVGTQDSEDPYWQIDTYIADTETAFKSINPAVELDSGYTTILEYYYNQLQSSADASNSIMALTSARDSADAKIAGFKTHNAAIVQLREVASECNDGLYNFSNMLGLTEEETNELLALTETGTQEEILGEIEAILAENGDGITVENVKEAFDALYENIEGGETSYRKLTAVYKATYESEGFTDIKEPYMSAEGLAQWETLNKIFGPAFVIPDENTCKAEADAWIEKLNLLAQRVSEIDKEYEYLTNDFAEVEACRTEYAALVEEYNSFEQCVKYFIDSTATETYTGLNKILNTDWPAAIAVMDKIDDAEAAVLTEEWAEKLAAAETALNTLQSDNAAAYEHVAEAAKAKLDQVRKDYDIYNRFESWLGSIENIEPKMVEEYAQLYTYNDEGDLEPSEFSLLIDKLVTDEGTLFEDLNQASQKVQEYINSADNDYLAASAAIAKLNKEKGLALAAEAIDKRIIALDSLTGDDFKTALESLRKDIDALVATISYEGEDKRGNDAAIEFNMLTQYAQYEYYVNNYDKAVADSFARAVEAVGDITYTTDLDAAKTAIEAAEALLDTLNDAQEKFAYSAILKLNVLNKKYDKISAAKEAAQDVLADITEMQDTIESTVLTADPYDYEYVKLIEGYSEVIAASDVVNQSIEAIKDTDAYQYLVQNKYIENYENALADFRDEYSYIGVMQAIEVLYEDSKNVISFDEEGNAVIDEEERDILIAETANTLTLYEALDPDLKENVLNYSSLQWLAKNIDAARVNGIIDAINSLPSADEITYAKYAGAVESVKADYESLLSENQARVRADSDGATYEKFMEILAVMGMYEEEYGDLGGKQGDVNGDDVIDINDVILMVDYAFGLKTVENEEDEKQFLRGNIVKETGVSEEKIDFHDIAAVIDLLEFED